MSNPKSNPKHNVTIHNMNDEYYGFIKSYANEFDMCIPDAICSIVHHFIICRIDEIGIGNDENEYYHDRTTAQLNEYYRKWLNKLRGETSRANI